MTRKHERLLNKHAKELAEHFEEPKYGWPLDYNLYVSELCCDLLGFDPGAELLKRLNARTPVKQVFKTGDTTIQKNPGGSRERYAIEFKFLGRSVKRASR